MLDNLPVSLSNSVGITFALQDTDSIRLDLVTAPVRIALITCVSMHPLSMSTLSDNASGHLILLSASASVLLTPHLYLIEKL